MVARNVLGGVVTRRVRITDTIPAGMDDDFVLFYREAYPGAVRLAWLLTHDHHAAEDVVQDAFMRVRPQRDPLRVWTPAEVLELNPAERGTVGSSYEYSGTNYLLLGLVIEHVRGRPLVEVMRAGVLAIDGIERLVYQPDEQPTEPMAMPRGESTAALERGGGYLPSHAATSANPVAGGMASDAPSLARWWQTFCAGEIVSQATLTEMSAFDPDLSPFNDGGYGLGLWNPAYGYARGVGHGGELFGYMSWAACLPEEGAVIVVLSNRLVYSLTLNLLSGALRPFVDALRSR